MPEAPEEQLLEQLSLGNVDAVAELFARDAPSLLLRLVRDLADQGIAPDEVGLTPGDADE